MGASASGIAQIGHEGHSDKTVKCLLSKSRLFELNYQPRMAAFPKWNGLKHFNAVSTIKFTDGQSFYDILKASCFFCYFSNHYKKPNTLLNSAFFLALLIYSPKIQL